MSTKKSNFLAPKKRNKISRVRSITRTKCQDEKERGCPRGQRKSCCWYWTSFPLFFYLSFHTEFFQERPKMSSLCWRQQEWKERSASVLSASGRASTQPTTVHLHNGSSVGIYTQCIRILQFWHQIVRSAPSWYDFEKKKTLVSNSKHCNKNNFWHLFFTKIYLLLVTL